MQSDRFSNTDGLKETSPVSATLLCCVAGGRDLKPPCRRARTFGRAPDDVNLDRGDRSPQLLLQINLVSLRPERLSPKFVAEIATLPSSGTKS
jgi:hypothetical protein